MAPRLGELGVTLLKKLESLEALFIKELLDAHAGNITAAAREAGIDRNSFRRRVRKYWPK